jgi:restriction system protein
MPPNQEPSTGWEALRALIALAIIVGLLLLRNPKRRRTAGNRYVLAAVVVFVVLGAAVRSAWGASLMAVGLGAFVWYRWFYLPRRRRFHIKTLGELLALTPRQFEAAVGEILRDTGYRDVRHVGGTGDLTADLTCRDDRGRSVVIQCKRYSPGIRIGSRDIQEFIGMMTVHHRADGGIFITTTEFTEPAVDLAKRHGIRLVDGQELTRLIAKSNRHENAEAEQPRT